jgi:DNA-binding HxlR family transcriptional regulator
MSELSPRVDVVAGPWAPLILRGLILGNRQFNEIHRGVPLLSGALLSQRLKEFEQAGVITRIPVPGRKLSEYNLTKMGEELKPIIVALGVWGQRWVESAINSNDWDAGAPMWDVRRRIDISALPDHRSVIHFGYGDAPTGLRA